MPEWLDQEALVDVASDFPLPLKGHRIDFFTADMMRNIREIALTGAEIDVVTVTECEEVLSHLTGIQDFVPTADKILN